MDERIVGIVAGSYTVQQVLDACPELSREDVTAALEYASHVVNEDKVIPRA